MNISCLQEHLAKGLSVVGRAVAARSTLPITANVLLATEQGRLKLAATNLEIALSCWVGAQVEEEGAITVPARLLTDFVNSLPNEKIEMTLAAADGFRLSVRKLTLPKAVKERTEVIIPQRALAELNRLLPEETDPVELTLNATRTQALFRLKNIELVAQLLQGTFPHYP